MTRPLYAIGQPVTHVLDPLREYRIIHRDIKLQGWCYSLCRDSQDYEQAKRVYEHDIIPVKGRPCLRVV